MSDIPPALAIHRRELRRLGGFLVIFAGLTGLSYVIPEAQAVQPWVPGEPIPVVHLLQRDTQVQETEQGALVVRKVEAEPTAPAASEPVQGGPSLPDRPPAVPTWLEIPDGALDSWFTALAQVESGQPGAMARALHWGDSTIAGDGITGTIRSRLQDRFGDGGPGFLAVQVDARWASRPGVARWPKGDWETKTITFGGSGRAHYGLAGTVSTATGEARSTLGGRQIDGQRQLLQRFDVFYETQPGGGVLHVKPKGAKGAYLPTVAEGYGDRFRLIEVPQGAETVTVWAEGDGPVTVYGVALETEGPGVIWDNLGVAGAGQGSMFRQNARHVARQVARRDPALLVYQSGGNELSYPSLVNNDGAVYLQNYEKIMGRLRAGAPEASCLVISPLDQGERVRGEIHSKPMLDRMIRIQRQAAFELGCAFWDARHAMGGDGGFARFLDAKMAWTDLNHLTNDGLDVVGQSLADAMEFSYDRWRADHGALWAELQAAAATRAAQQQEAASETQADEGGGDTR